VSCPLHALPVRVLSLLTTVVLAAACGDQRGQGSEGAVTLSQGGSAGEDESADESADESDDESTSTSGLLDIGNTGTTGDEECTAPFPADPDPEGTLPCGEQAPPDSWDAEVQWSFEAGESYHTPLVINLTDDDNNGVIDVCDVPDVILLAGVAFGLLYVLDGETGQEHFHLPVNLDPSTTPAVGDIDNDGLPEIVAAIGTPFAASLVAFEHDGTMKWTSNQIFVPNGAAAIGIGNFDNSGFAEVYVGGLIVNGNNGQAIFNAPAQAGFLGASLSAPVAADLDGDGDLELIRGQDAYHDDGTVYYQDITIEAGFPQVGNLDDDPEPEVLLINTQGITVLEHDGTVKFGGLRPTGDPAGFSWFRPATIHDFDGDGISEFAVSSGSHYAAYRRNAMVMWIADVNDASGVAAGTAFDFLGDGTAEAMFADEYKLFAFDIHGAPLMEVDRSSGTLIEYPSVADVDNDGSAEILVVSNKNFDMQQLTPTLQVIGDKDDRWIQARRIWNQHTYHVTNVNEDGTIPMVEPPSWSLLNTYRTNAQIEGGSVCAPPPIP
jgi:hypothetical protein